MFKSVNCWLYSFYQLRRHTTYNCNYLYFRKLYQSRSYAACMPNTGVLRYALVSRNQIAYTKTVKALYGRNARPINDKLPGKAVCKMLGIPTHPMVK